MPFPSRLSTAILVVLATTVQILQVHAQDYNLPGCKHWPTPEDWDRDLRKKLWVGKLHGPFIKFPNHAYYENCLTSDPTVQVLSEGQGLCMFYNACVNQECRLTSAGNLPAYTLEARTVYDIQVAMEFANLYNIGVSVKSSGHSYQGQSTQAGSLLIWVRKFPENNIVIGDNSGITDNFVDSCGTEFGPTIGVVAGENFDMTLQRVRGNYTIASGLCRTVSSSGGWLQGGGLSYNSRMIGFGVDQARSFDVVLADGSLVTADACTHSDLFWALRGGGGGNYGIVTKVETQLHPTSKYVQLRWGTGAIVGPLAACQVEKRHKALMREWVEFFVRTLPTTERRWTGGLVNIGGADLTFEGDINEARESELIVAMDAWFDDMVARDILSPDDEWYDEYNRPSTSMSEVDSWSDRYGDFEDEAEDPTISTPGIIARGISRFIPTHVALERTEELIDLFYDIGTTGNMLSMYYLGGKVADIGKDETSVHPGARDVLFGVNLPNDPGNNKMLKFAGDEAKDWSVSYNHHDAREEDWEEVLYGPQIDRLREIKSKYDPDHRFNVYHGVDFKPISEMKCAGRDLPNVCYLPAFMATFLTQAFGFLSPADADDKPESHLAPFEY